MRRLDDGCGMHRNRRRGGDHCDHCSAFDFDFYVAALECELSDIFFYEELDQLFELFLVHVVSSGRTEVKINIRPRAAGSTPFSNCFQRVMSSFGVGVSTSQPRLVTRTMSSILTPPLPGM